MFCCPVCKTNSMFESPSALRTHISKHKIDGYPFKYPLKCVQADCEGKYATLDSFIVHVNSKHKNDFGFASNGNHSSFNEFCGTDRGINNATKSQVTEARPNETLLNSYDTALDNLLLNLYSNSSIPHSSVEEIVKHFEDFLVILNSRIVQIGSKVPPDTVNLPFSQASAEIQKALSAVKSVNTKYKAKKRLSTHPLFVEPQIVHLGTRNDAFLINGSEVNNSLRNEESIYISIIETIKVILSDPEIANLILDEFKLEIESDPNIYSDYKDGSAFKTHLLFSDRTKTSLRIQIFYDGMGTTNPLRGHGPAHSVGVFYFTIQNLPHSYNTCFPNVHLFSVCYTADIKKYGFERVLSKLMDEINILETTGISVDIPERGIVNIFGSISQFSGDCLATNEIFGLICSFSHDFHCSICYGEKQTMSSLFKEENFVLRTKELHNRDLQNLTSNPSLVHSRGVKQNSVFSKSKYYCVALHRLIDIMHVLPEGIIPYVLSCILYEFIYVRKLLSLQDLNEKIRWFFSTSEIDKGNTPPEFNEIKAAGAGLSPKCTANELLCLFRYIPFILSEFIEDKDDNHWELLIQLQIITDIVFSPKLDESLLNYFSELYEEHLTLFKKLYPQLTIKPKQHYLVHFPTIVRTNGPPTHSSCFKYELRNSFFKRASHIVCNFKNIPKTLANRNQLTSLSHTLKKSRARGLCVPVSKLSPVLISALPGAQTIASRMSLPIAALVFTTLKVEISGRSFSKGNVLILSKSSEDYNLQFGVVQTIIIPQSKTEVFFLIKRLETVGLDSSLNGYLVKVTKPPLSELVNISDLLDFHPLDLTIPFKNHDMYVRLRYHVW